MGSRRGEIKMPFHGRLAAAGALLVSSGRTFGAARYLLSDNEGPNSKKVDMIKVWYVSRSENIFQHILNRAFKGYGDSSAC
jgi:hypothetical protein